MVAALQPLGGALKRLFVTVRLFVAIELSDAVRTALQRVQEGLRRSCEGVRWVRMDQAHLTIKFLGEVPDGSPSEVSEAVSRGAAAAEPFDMEFAGCGCFPPRGAVRVIWAGAGEQSGALLRYVEATEAELEAVGFERERRGFSAHITLGRVREDRSGGSLREAVDAAELRAVDQTVTSVVLMSSVLSPKGPTYSVVSRALLGKDA